MFPVGLGYIATAIKRGGFQFDLLDIDAHRYSNQEINDFITSKRYDVICLGCIVTGYKIVKSLSYLIKKHHPHSIIIAGNSVATSIPEILLNKTEVDIAVMGEGDETIIELLNAISEDKPMESIKGICIIKDGKFVKTPERPYIKDISSLPFIDYSIWNIEIYIKNASQYIKEPSPIPRKDLRALPVNTARGCIGNCTFCYHVFKKICYRYRNPDSITNEVKQLINTYSLNYILFWDELTFFSKKQTQKLVEKIINEKLRFYWIGNCRADLFNNKEDLEIIKKMKEAGCVGMTYSLESADPSILKAMNKNISIEQFSKQTQLFHKADLPTWTSLVFGYPQETPETIKKTFDICIENNIYPSSGYLLPQPGSKMYEYAINNGFIKNEEDYLLAIGDRQDLRINLTNMNDDELTTNVISGLDRCNKILNIGLKKENLIKTQYYRAAKINKKYNELPLIFWLMVKSRLIELNYNYN